MYTTTPSRRVSDEALAEAKNLCNPASRVDVRCNFECLRFASQLLINVQDKCLSDDSAVLNYNRSAGQSNGRLDLKRGIGLKSIFCVFW